MNTLLDRSIGEVQKKSYILKNLSKNGYELVYQILNPGPNERFIVICVSPSGRMRRYDHATPKIANHHYNFWVSEINKAPKDNIEIRQCALRSSVIAMVLADHPVLANYLIGR